MINLNHGVAPQTFVVNLEAVNDSTLSFGVCHEAATLGLDTKYVTQRKGDALRLQDRCTDLIRCQVEYP